MRLIDADALEELFRETISHIAKNPKMSGNLEHMVRASAMVIEMIKDAPTIEPQKWILCSERMPEEHDSIFSKLYGTEKWRNAMFRRSSRTVIITVEHKDGTRQTAPCHTIDGEWNQSMKGMGKVLAWMPLPECYRGDENVK